MQTETERRKKRKHYNIPGHAHYLTFSCYHRFDYLSDPESRSIFMEELDHARSELQFNLWAYVLMPNHVYLLYPYQQVYKISSILQAIKGRTSKRYSAWLRETYPRRYEDSLIRIGLNRKFRFWQAGGGFDRNLWNPEAIHRAIDYIESNPFRATLVGAPEDWTWSSAHARATGCGVVPDKTDVPMMMK